MSSSQADQFKRLYAEWLHLRGDAVNPDVTMTDTDADDAAGRESEIIAGMASIRADRMGTVFRKLEVLRVSMNDAGDTSLCLDLRTLALVGSIETDLTFIASKLNEFDLRIFAD